MALPPRTCYADMRFKPTRESIGFVPTGQAEYVNPVPFDLKIALIISAFIDSSFLTEEKQKQMYWVHFYGVYLDNGWFYVYRSHFILLRFQIKDDERGIRRISNLQISDDPHERIAYLGYVLEVLE